MIISRMIGKQRIALSERPSWIGAWGLVALDLLVTTIVFGALAVVIITWAEGDRITNGQAMAGLFFLCFVPTQVLLIISAIWAAKSRWEEAEPR